MALSQAGGYAEVLLLRILWASKCSRATEGAADLATGGQWIAFAQAGECDDGGAPRDGTARHCRWHAHLWLSRYGALLITGGGVERLPRNVPQRDGCRTGGAIDASGSA